MDQTLKKVDNAAGRYLVRLSSVYNGTHPGFEVNWSGGHSMRRPSSQRIVSQCSVIISGGSDSLHVARGMNHGEESMSSLDGMVPASGPRRLHLTL